MSNRLFRVVIPDPDLLKDFRELYAEYEYDSDALLGFQMAEGGGLWSLVAGSGDILARSRDKRDVFGSLHAFVDELAAPAPRDGAVRFAMRALIDRRNGAATLFGPNAERFGPITERRLTRLELAVVDSRFTDIDASGSHPRLAMSHRMPRDQSPGPGHERAGELSGVVVSLVVPEMLPPWADISQAGLAWALACSTRSGTRKERLWASLQLTSPPVRVRLGASIGALYLRAEV